MRSLKLLAALLLVAFTSLAQVSTVTIGAVTGASSYQAGPIYRFSTAQSTNYSRYIYLYTKEEMKIPSGATITKLEWLKSNSATASGNKFSVSLLNTSRPTLGTSGYWADYWKGSRTVFRNDNFGFSSALNLWVPAPLESFTYFGGNLAILTDWTKVGSCTGPLTFYNQASAGKALQVTTSVAFTEGPLLMLPTPGNLRPTIRITYVPAPSCTGTPSPGNVVSSATKVCPGKEFTLSLSNSLSEGNLVYDWQSSASPDFSNPQSIGQFSSTVVSQSSRTYYRCKVTCSASNSSTTTQTLEVPMNEFYDCYCESAAVSPVDEEIVHFKLANVDQSSAKCGELAPGEGSAKSLYSNYRSLPTTDLEAGNEVPFILETDLCGKNGAYNRAAIFLDLNRNGAFEDNEMLYFSSVVYGPTPNIRKGYLKIPSTASTGKTGLRVILSETQNGISACGTYSFGETEDYVVNLVHPASPVPSDPSEDIYLGSIVGQTRACRGSSVLMYPSNFPAGDGITYRWYVNGAPVDSAKGFFYEPVITVASEYVCEAVSQNGTTSRSEPLNVDLKPFIDCYCPGGAAVQADEDIYSFTLNDVTVGLACTEVAPGEGSVINQYSNYHPNGAFTTLVRGGTYDFSLVDDDCDYPLKSPYYTSSVAGWIDFNQNGVFEDGEKVFQEDGVLGPKTLTGKITIPKDAKPGVTGLRLVMGGGLWGPYLAPCSKFQSGETEDHLVKIAE